MLRHYVTHMPFNGYKAQVVAYSRRAALRYHAALEQARTALLVWSERILTAETADAVFRIRQGVNNSLFMRAPTGAASVDSGKGDHASREDM